jgi:hypothetical protein
VGERQLVQNWQPGMAQWVCAKITDLKSTSFPAVILSSKDHEMMICLGLIKQFMMTSTSIRTSIWQN